MIRSLFSIQPKTVAVVRLSKLFCMNHASSSSSKRHLFLMALSPNFLQCSSYGGQSQLANLSFHFGSRLARPKISSSSSRIQTFHQWQSTRNLASGPFSTPDRETRRHRLLIATYISCALGAIILSAVGLKHFKKLSKAAIGIEEVKAREYGRFPIMYSYRGYIFLDMIANDVRNIHQFEVREDDVWVVTFPKAGTTWLQEIVYLICNDVDFEKAASAKLDDRIPFFEYPIPGKKAIAAMPSPRLIKSHLPISILPNQMKEKKPKIIYLARNPKDTVVSYYHFMVKFFEPTNKFHGSFEDYCRLFLEDKIFWGPWWKHVLEAWNKRDDDNLLFLFYEDMHEDLPKVIRQLALFLGKTLTEEQIESIVNHCRFDRMKTDKSLNYDWLRDEGLATKDNSVTFLRKGVVGDWRNHLSAETAKKFDEMVAEKILPAGIPFKDTLPEKSEL